MSARSRLLLVPVAVLLAAAVPIAILAAGGSGAGAKGALANPMQRSEFGSYWFSSSAEISRYALEQSRYGETRGGDAVLIFVTEDFLPEKQVKADEPDRARSGALPILKMNFTKRFFTGVYPYSIMTSVFTPIDLSAHPRTLKSTTSVQEWCGHTFLQLNHRDGDYEVRGYSYFESEGDRSFTLDGAWLEDGIWTLIRLDPSAVPRGKVPMIPGGEQHRLLHRPLEILDAALDVEAGPGGLSTCRIEYSAAGRTLAIRFQTAFPHRIEGWEETLRTGGKTLTTKATRTHTERLDYWKHNAVADDPLRSRLGL